MNAVMVVLMDGTVGEVSMYPSDRASREDVQHGDDVIVIAKDENGNEFRIRGLIAEVL